MKIITNNKGVTLVEMIVTFLIFALIIGAGMGVLVSSIKIQRYNLTQQRIMSQASYAVEFIDRAVRMAQRDEGLGCLFTADLNYEDKLIPGTDISGLMFVSSDGVCTGIFLDNGQLKEYEQGRTPEILELTSSDFNVAAFNYTITGASKLDTLQPKVEIYLEITGTNPGDNPTIKMQTTTSQRNLDM